MPAPLENKYFFDWSRSLQLTDVTKLKMRQASENLDPVRSSPVWPLISPLFAIMKTNKTSDQSSARSSHGHSRQITEEEQVCWKEGGMWSGVEDETEYETVKWTSTLLIHLFDLCLGCSLKSMTPHRAAWGHWICLSALIHTPCIQTDTQPHRRTYSM